MRYKAKSAVKTVINNNEGIRTTVEQPRPRKISYAQALKSSTNTFEKRNSTKHNESKPSKNASGKLRSLSPANRRPKQEIIWSKNNSKTDLSSNYKYHQEIKQLKEEIKLLK